MEDIKLLKHHYLRQKVFYLSHVQLTNVFKECKEVLSHSLTLWLPKYMAILDNKQETAGSVDPVEVCPLHYGTRIALVRMLIEMEMWEEATKVSLICLVQSYLCLQTGLRT